MNLKKQHIKSELDTLRMFLVCTMEITDDYMKEMLEKTKSYSIVILHKTEKRKDQSADKIAWEHGRRNFELLKEGKIVLIFPIRDESDISGISVYGTNIEETKKIVDNDPAVKAGIFTYELHSTRSFPGLSLP